LPVCPCYKHVGTILDWRGGASREVRARAGASSSALRELRGRVFRKELPRNVTVAAASAFCHSRLLYNAELLGALTSGQTSKLRHAYIAPLRAAMGMAFVSGPGAASDAEVFALAGKPSFERARQQTRLRFFARMLAVAPPQLLFLLDLEESWIGLLCLDLDELAAFLELEAPRAAVDMAWWKGYVAQRARWKGLIKRFALAATESDARVDVELDPPAASFAATAALSAMGSAASRSTCAASTAPCPWSTGRRQHSVAAPARAACGSSTHTAAWPATSDRCRRASITPSRCRAGRHPSLAKRDALSWRPWHGSQRSDRP
jgi:hypothetical protein